MTKRLYFDDPELFSFDARVVGVEGDNAVVLDRSAFYPEAGGQMADHGTLGDARVIDVQVVGDRVLHFIEGGLPAVGAEVHGEIEPARRRAHMALHTGQHILSRALIEVGGHETVSARLGETACTIDIDSERIDDAALGRAEDLATAVVEDDVMIEAFFPSPEELAKLTLRREAKVTEDVRIVRVGDFDVTPCGGTHCLRSAQVGLIAITGLERRKRRMRITFTSGPRARRQLGREAAQLRQLARGLSCSTDDIGGGIDKIRSELSAARHELKELSAVAAAQLASALARTGEPTVAVLDAPAGLVRDIARLLTDTPGRVALLAARTEEGLHVVLARGEGASFDCGALMSAAAKATGGKGGGRPDRAEGRLPAGTDWPALCSELMVVS